MGKCLGKGLGAGSKRPLTLALRGQVQKLVKQNQCLANHRNSREIQSGENEAEKASEQS